MAPTVVAQRKDLFASELIGPDGSSIGSAADREIFVGHPDRSDPAFDVALNMARPWRARAREGTIYRH